MGSKNPSLRVYVCKELEKLGFIVDDTVSLWHYTHPTCLGGVCIRVTCALMGKDSVSLRMKFLDPQQAKDDHILWDDNIDGFHTVRKITNQKTARKDIRRLFKK
jgi:hypothetical protein